MKNFVEVHQHIQSLDTGSTLDSFIKRELELGTGYITITDHGTLGAVYKTYELAKKNGLKLIPGLEGYFRDDNCPIVKSYGVENVKDYMKYQHITMHFMDQAAYEAGVRILSKADLNRAEQHGSERKPIFDWNDLEELGSYNVTMASSCLIGMVSRPLLDQNNVNLAINYYEKLRSIVKPGNFYVEVFPHRCDKNWVNAVFIIFEDGTSVKLYNKKKLRTNEGEIDASELAADFQQKNRAHLYIREIKDYHTWKPYTYPDLKIVQVKQVADYLPNECRPWCPDGDPQLGCNHLVHRLAQKYGDPILISSDSHYAHPDDKIVQEIRLSTMGDNFRFYGSYERKSTDSTIEYFKNYMHVPEKEIEQWVENSYSFAEKFKDFKFRNTPSLPVSFYPNDTLKHCMSLIKKHGRMDWKNPAMVARLKSEIDLLHKNGKVDFLPYFFMFEEFCAKAEERQELTGWGRGSAAGLLLTNLLGVTHADPLKYELSQDRFMTLDRVLSGKYPDLDQDLQKVTRDYLVDPDNGYLKQRFGDCYSSVSVDTSLKLRSSIKDVHRAVHGKVQPEVERLVSKMKVAPQGVTDREFIFGYEADGEHVQGSIEYDTALKTYVERYPKEWEMVQKLLGLVRGKGRHASAKLVANEPIANFIPLTKVSDVPVTQYTANSPEGINSVESVGGIKLDLLGLNTLSDVQGALRIIQDRCGVDRNGPDRIINGKRVPAFRILLFQGKEYDIYDPPEEQAVFRDICEGKTETVFQFDTPSAKGWLEYFDEYKPGTDHKGLDSIEALGAFTALDRPGPLDAYVTAPDGAKHNMLVEYANRAKGKAPVGEIPILTQLLPETYGVLCYQEQLTKVFRVLGDTTGQEAEAFRVHTSKKQVTKVIKDKEIFMRGAVPKLGQELAETVWGMLVTFANYGFNKSHAICYVHTSYCAAFLKHHFPLEWWTAVLRNADKDEISTKFWSYCHKFIDMPDINNSRDQFEIINERIQAPISMLNGIGEKAHDQLCKYRPYKDIQDFCDKIVQHQEATATFHDKIEDGKKVVVKKKGRNAINRGMIYKMIVTGVMDSLFAKDLDTMSKLMEYEVAMLTAQGKTKRSSPRIDEAYENLDTLSMFQLKKEILPAYSEPLLPILLDHNVPKIVNKRFYQRDERFFDKRRKITVTEQKQYLVLDKDRWLRVNEAEELKMLSHYVALPCFVVNEKQFSYVQKDGKNKTAAKLTLDLEGHVFEMVKWPNWDNELPECFKESLVGSLVIVLAHRKPEQDEFSIVDVELIRKPFSLKKEESA